MAWQAENLAEVHHLKPLFVTLHDSAYASLLGMRERE
jgi:hypothetical protein